MPRYKKFSTKANKARMANVRRGKLGKANRENAAPAAGPPIEANEEDIPLAERLAENTEKRLQEITKQLKAIQHDFANALDREERLKCAAVKQVGEELKRVNEIFEDLARNNVPTVTAAT